MTEQLQLSWGLQPPEGATVAWGARTIFKAGAIDILHDRQDCKGDDRKAFLRDVNGHMDMIRSEADLAWRQGDLRGDKAGRVTLIWQTVEDDLVVVVEADTRASYGYLYIVAYKIKETQVSEPAPARVTTA